MSTITENHRFTKSPQGLSAKQLAERLSQELAELAPAHCNVAYNRMVEIGKLRLRENRQVAEIRQFLLERRTVDLCTKRLFQIVCMLALASFFDGSSLGLTHS